MFFLRRNNVNKSQEIWKFSPKLNSIFTSFAIEARNATNWLSFHSHLIWMEREKNTA